MFNSHYNISFLISSLEQSKKPANTLAGFEHAYDLTVTMFLSLNQSKRS